MFLVTLLKIFNKIDPFNLKSDIFGYERKLCKFVVIYQERFAFDIHVWYTHVLSNFGLLRFFSPKITIIIFN